jgi:hypothetical protein
MWSCLSGFLPSECKRKVLAMPAKSSTKNTRRSSKPKKTKAGKPASHKTTKKPSATKARKGKKSIAKKSSKGSTTKKSAAPKGKKKTGAKKSTGTPRKKTSSKTTKAQVKSKKSASTKSTKKTTSSRSKALKTFPRKLSNKPKASSKKLPRKGSQPSATRSASSSSVEKLSSEVRYNAGGVCASLLNSSSKKEKTLLSKLLKNLGLSVIEQRNLLQLSQGFTIPKLFADGIKEERDRKKVSSFLRSETVNHNTPESLGNQFMKEIKLTLAS